MLNSARGQSRVDARVGIGGPVPPLHRAGAPGVLGGVLHAGYRFSDEDAVSLTVTPGEPDLRDPSGEEDVTVLGRGVPVRHVMPDGRLADHRPSDGAVVDPAKHGTTYICCGSGGRPGGG